MDRGVLFSDAAGRQLWLPYCAACTVEGTMTLAGHVRPGQTISAADGISEPLTVTFAHHGARKPASAAPLR